MSSIRALTGSCPARFPDGPTIVPYRIPPTQADIEIANAVSNYTNPPTEEVASALTLGADEHVLLAIAAGWWLYSRGAPRASAGTATTFWRRHSLSVCSPTCSNRSSISVGRTG